MQAGITPVTIHTHLDSLQNDILSSQADQSHASADRQLFLGKIVLVT